jgi:negative regulator of sigma E activity
MGLTPQHERMNRALDEPLSGAELIEFQALLEADQERAALFARLREVDDLLRQPPMVKPSPQFAGKVMTRIEAREYEVYAPRRQWARLASWFGLALGVAAVPLALVMVLVAPMLAQTGAALAVIRTVVSGLGAVSAAAERVLTAVAGVIAAYPMMPALSLTVIPMVMLWAWLVWYLRQQNRPQTIVIPVQVV